MTLIVKIRNRSLGGYGTVNALHGSFSFLNAIKLKKWVFLNTFSTTTSHNLLSNDSASSSCVLHKPLGLKRLYLTGA
jgi:hypothetical protein